MYPKRKGWKAVTSGRVFDLYREVVSCAQDLGLWGNQAPPPLYTRKSASSFGSCFNRKNSKGEEEIALVLNELLLGYSDDQIREVIVHEFAHAICIGHHHDSYWKKTANAIGKKWGYKITPRCKDAQLNAAIFQLKDAKHPYEYELYCPVCGATWKYRRMCEAVRHPEKYWCQKDKTTLRSRKITN